MDVAELAFAPTSYTLKTLGNGQEMWIPLGRKPQDYADEVAMSMGIAITPPPTAQAAVDGAALEVQAMAPLSSPEAAQTESLEVAVAAEVAVLEAAAAGLASCEALIMPPARRPVISVLGGPGSGKSTQCGKLAAAFGYKHLSVGKLLQEVAANGHAEVAKHMQAGNLVPTAVVTAVIMDHLDSEDGGIILDGFPRVAEQSKPTASPHHASISRDASDGVRCVSSGDRPSAR